MADTLLQTLQGLWRELPGLLSDRIELLSLELRRAGLALAQIVMLIVAAAILGATAWLALWIGIVAALMAFGMPMALALALVLAINLAAAWLALAHVRRLLHTLGLPATRRHLMFSPSTEPTAAPASNPAPASAPTSHSAPDPSPPTP